MKAKTDRETQPKQAITMQKCSQGLWAFFVGIPLGVAWESWVRGNGGVWLLTALAAGVVAVWPKMAKSWFVLVFVVGMIAGMSRTGQVLHDRLESGGDFQEYTVTGEARLAGEWSENAFAASVPIEWERCFDRDCPRENSLLQVRFREAWLPGELLRVQCRVTLPKNLSPDFDYRAYLAKEGIGTLCIASEQPELLSGRETWETTVFRIKARLEQSLAQAVPEPENGFLAGLIFGGSDRLPKALQEDFQKTGVSHVVAVSGYNVLIVAEALLLLGIALGLWRAQATWFSLAGIWLFALITGAGASVLRAATMASVVLVATLSGRLIASWRLIVLMLVILLWANPLLLRYDIGFQLSVMATAVLLFGFRESEWSLGSHDAWWRPLFLLVGATLAIEIFVAPVLLMQFGFVSTVSLLVNALVLPVIPAAMMLAFATSIIGLFLPAAYNIFAWPSYVLARAVLGVVEYFGHQSWSTASFSLTPWGALLWYALVLSLWYSYRKRRSDRNEAL